MSAAVRTGHAWRRGRAVVRGRLEAARRSACRRRDPVRAELRILPTTEGVDRRDPGVAHARAARRRRSRRRPRATLSHGLQRDTSDARAGGALGSRCRGGRARGVADRTHDRRGATRARRGFQLHAGARSRLRREHSNRRPGAASQSERGCASRGGAPCGTPRGRNVRGRQALSGTWLCGGRLAKTSPASTVGERSLAEITAEDLVPFGVLVHHALEAIMPAHVIYPAIDAVPAG